MRRSPGPKRHDTLSRGIMLNGEREAASCASASFLPNSKSVGPFNSAHECVRPSLLDFFFSLSFVSAGYCSCLMKISSEGPGRVHIAFSS